jgi:hypothetical protein
VNILLTGAAVIYFVFAALLLFLPQETLRSDSAQTIALAQVAAAAIFGNAMMNWMSRYSTIGGIYGRPIVVANLAHAFTAAATLARPALAGEASVPMLVALPFYAVLTIAFAYKMYASPGAKA